MSRILRGNDLWNSVENFPGLGSRKAARRGPGETGVVAEPGTSRHGLRACSACAGDYEDPDRTAWVPDSEDVDELLGESAPERATDPDGPDDEFPAREK
ncbi:MAG: hypothetical protein WA765_19865 [Candidatus Acidiferrum sp.]